MLTIEATSAARHLRLALGLGLAASARRSQDGRRNERLPHGPAKRDRQGSRSTSAGAPATGPRRLRTASATRTCSRREVCEPPPPKPAAAPPPASAPAPGAPPPPKPVAEKVTFAADVLFDFDKAVLKPEGKSKLDDLANKLKGVNLEVVIAIGHTDPIGSDAYNQKLSVRRAEAVKAYLVCKGIEPNRIYTEGKGKSSRSRSARRRTR